MAPRPSWTTGISGPGISRSEGVCPLWPGSDLWTGDLWSMCPSKVHSKSRLFLMTSKGGDFPPAFSAACLPASWFSFLWESFLSFGMALQLSVSLWTPSACCLCVLPSPLQQAAATVWYFFNQHVFNIYYVRCWARRYVDEQLPDLIRVENKFYHCTKYTHCGLSLWHYQCPSQTYSYL